MNEYTASMKQDLHSLEKCCRTQTNEFEPIKKLLPAVLGVGFVFVGWFLLDNIAFRLLFIASGCFALTSLNIAAQLTARKLYDSCGGKFPNVKYRFSDNGFLPDYKEEQLPYSDLIRIIDDGEFLYLYVSRDTAYMIDRKTVTGSGGVAGLKKIISSGASIQWASPKNLLAFRLKSPFSGSN